MKKRSARYASILPVKRKKRYLMYCTHICLPAYLIRYIKINTHMYAWPNYTCYLNLFHLCVTLCCRQGNAQYKQGKYEAAVTCYTRGLESDPTNILLAANRGMAYLALKRCVWCGDYRRLSKQTRAWNGKGDTRESYFGREYHIPHLSEKVCRSGERLHFGATGRS